MGTEAGVPRAAYVTPCSPSPLSQVLVSPGTSGNCHILRPSGSLSTFCPPPAPAADFGAPSWAARGPARKAARTQQAGVCTGGPPRERGRAAGQVKPQHGARVPLTAGRAAA